MACLDDVPREEIDWGPIIDEAACRDGCRASLDFCQQGVYDWVDGKTRGWCGAQLVWSAARRA